MKALLLNKCLDDHKWYAPYVGCIVPFRENPYPNEYKSIEKAGYINFVSSTDAEIIEVQQGAEFYVPYIQDN